MKVCLRCAIEKNDTEFCNHSQTKDGLQPSCKSCVNDRVRPLGQAYRLKNKAKLTLQQRAYRSRNREKLNAETRKWKSENPAKRNANLAKRRATKLQATPSWANKDALYAIYKEAHKLGKHVDHIIPLSSPTVCGLHWEGNLQLLDPIENMRKSNHY